MLSRVAETLYWMARYVERAENIARVVNINNMLLMDLPKGVSTGWEPLVDIIGVRKEYQEHHDDFSEINCLRYFVLGENNPSSILNSISYARENARTVRDVIPRGVWEGINSLYHYIKDNQNQGLTKRGRFEYLKKIIESTHLIFGALDATINHDQAYIFIRFGSIIERADMTTRIIDVRSANLIKTDDNSEKPFENIQWISVLRSLSAYQMYRQQMGIRVKREDVLEFMLINPVFPRSFLFCLQELKSLIQKIDNSDSIIKLLDAACTEIKDKNVRSLKNADLHDYIDELQIDLADVHTELAEVYFLKSV